MTRSEKDLRIVIVDDERPARDLLAQYLSERPGYEAVALCADGFEAVKAVSELEPDVLLLDIQMPKLDGFEVLELLEQPPQVIFTTAHDEYALKAFEVQAVDYLLKPFSSARLFDALQRAAERVARGTDPEVEGLRRYHREASKPLHRVLVREGTRVHVLPPPEIDYVESQDDYVVFHVGGRRYRKKQTLTELEELLPAGFVRIHRCYLVNVDRLRRIEPYAKGSRLAFLSDGTRLPVSRSGYGRLKRRL